MEQSTRRKLVTAAVLAVATSLLVLFIAGGQKAPTGPTPIEAVSEAQPSSVEPSVQESGELSSPTASTNTLEAATAVSVESLVKPAYRPGVNAQSAFQIGSLEDSGTARVTLDAGGGGVVEIRLSDEYEKASDLRAAEAGEDLPEEAHYLLAEAIRYPLPSTEILLPQLSVFELQLNGSPVPLWGEIPAWSSSRDEQGVVTAVATIEAGPKDARVPVLRITRSFYPLDGYHFDVETDIENLSDQTLEVALNTVAPSQLRVDAARYMDRRTLRAGVLDAGARVVRPSAIDESRESLAGGEAADFWMPNQGSNIAWLAATNRYFALAMMPAESATRPSLEDQVRRIRVTPIATNNGGEDEQQILVTARTSATRLEAGQNRITSFRIWAGPQDRSQLREASTVQGLQLDRLVVYSMGGFCTFCTFQWLASLLLSYLGALHGIVGDWAVAIVFLVVTVRLLLHPIVRRSQINMQRFSRRMAKVKPEMDALQKRYAGDAKRLQQEQARLFREKGVNPLHMLGCLPMFLQTPVWIALYAGLYLAVEMRHEPAFFGMFQSMTGDAWGFLADLSDQDHMFATFSEPVQVLLFRLTGINGLPLMMGLIFYLQQKYMTPPATGTQTPEQEQMQKIMRWMLVITFPLFLYGAPSGLTLYIVTSSTIGILESRWIRKKVDTMDLDSDPPPKPAGPRGSGNAGGSGDQSRAYSRAMSRYERRRDTRKKQDGRETKRPPRR